MPTWSIVSSQLCSHREKNPTAINVLIKIIINTRPQHVLPVLQVSGFAKSCLSNPLSSMFASNEYDGDPVFCRTYLYHTREIRSDSSACVVVLSAPYFITNCHNSNQSERLSHFCYWGFWYWGVCIATWLPIQFEKRTLIHVRHRSLLSDDLYLDPCLRPRAFHENFHRNAIRLPVIYVWLIRTSRAPISPCGY